MIKKHVKPLSILSIAVIIGAFGVSGVISATNKPKEQIANINGVSEVNKPLILPTDDQSSESESVNEIYNNNLSSTLAPGNNISSQNTSKYSEDEDEDEDEDHKFESMTHSRGRSPNKHNLDD